MQRQQEKNKGLQRYKLYIITCITLVLCPINEAFSGIREVYTVNNIQVDEQGSSATDARKKALNKSQEEALMTLLKRLTASSSHFYLADLEINNIASMVRKIEVKEEKITNKRYRANMSISFSPEYIQAILRDNAIPFIDKESPATLIIPVYHKGRNTFLWEPQNEWRISLEESVPDVMLLNLIVPLGDLEDLRYTVNNIRYGNFQQLKPLAKKYNAEEIVILEAKDGPHRMHIEARTISAQGERHQVINIMKDQPSQLSLLERAVSHSLMRLEDAWKTQTQQAATETLTLALTVPVRSLKDWVELKKRVTALPFLKKVHIKELASSEVDIHIEYRGELDRLLTKLNEYNFYLVEKDEKLLLRSST